MAPKKEGKPPKAGAAKSATTEVDEFGKITTASDLKNFLQTVLDRMKEETAPAIYVTSAMNHVLNLPEVYSLLNNENRELARDIWLRLKQAGVQLRNPPLLFEEGDGVVEGI